MGGDDFVIVIEPWNRPGISEPADAGVKLDRDRAIRVAQRVVSTLSLPITVNGVEHVVSASIAYSTWTDDGRTSLHRRYAADKPSGGVVIGRPKLS